MSAETQAERIKRLAAERLLAYRVGRDRHGNRYDCACVQRGRIREALGFPAPTARTTK